MTAGVPLLVTRPDPGGAATVRAAKAMGLDARHIPLFAAHALPWTAPDAADFDALLLTSAQAARLAGAELARLAALPAYAVGAATAAAATAAGLDVAMVGTGGARSLIDAMTSRGLRRILWLCGRDRTAIDAGAAALRPFPCYAVDPVDPPRGWFDLVAAPAVLLAHSARAAARIAALTEGRRSHLALVAIGPAAATAAGEGWKECTVALRPDDAAMLAEAHALCHKGRK